VGTATTSPSDRSVADGAQERAIDRALVVLLGALGVTILLRETTTVLDGSGVRTWSTLFMAMSVQAFPFLVLGVVVSGLIAAFVSPTALQRLLPRRQGLAVPVAGLYGMALPGCECGSVPIAGRLIAGGLPAAPSLTFLLAAPAINPVVLISTAVAFPGQPGVVLARFVAALVAAIAVGWWWTRRANTAVSTPRSSHDHDHRSGNRLQTFASTTLHDLVMAGGYLVVGAAVAASIQIVVPRTVVDQVAGNEITAILTLTALAIVLSICSEADAFVAAGLPQFSMTSRLVFLVVGPMLDLKLIAMQQGTFGSAFVRRFAPATVLAAVGSAAVVGQVLL
jgi:uncharacterized protein